MNNHSLKYHHTPKTHWTLTDVTFALWCPGVIYHCDLSKPNPEPKVFREVEVKGIKQEDFLTSQVTRSLHAQTPPITHPLCCPSPHLPVSSLFFCCVITSTGCTLISWCRFPRILVSVVEEVVVSGVREQLILASLKLNPNIYITAVPFNNINIWSFVKD